MKLFVTIGFIILTLSVAYPQQFDSSKIEIGQTHAFFSTILNEERKVSIYLPRSFTGSKITYPVIYVLDGGSLFVPVVGAVQFMNYSSHVGQIPEAIVVGIQNTNRERDMPVPQKIMKTDGVKNFLLFLTKELIPFIKDHYPVNGLNILIGHSQGGLFATYAGVEETNTFRCVLSLDAPLTIDAEVLKVFRRKMEKSISLHYYSAETLYGWGKELPIQKEGQDFGQIKIENETHETMPYKGMYEGLRFFFKDHIPKMNDLSLSSLKDYYISLSKKNTCDYCIPAKVLISQAIPMMVGRQKKKESLELIEYYEFCYGKNTASDEMRRKTNNITTGPDERIEYYLNHTTASIDSIKPFLGKWKGMLVVPGGINTEIEWEIKKADGKFSIESLIMNEFKTKSDFLVVKNNREIHWGRKHQGGGIYLSVGKLSNDGNTIQGSEDLIGHLLSEGEPEFRQNSFIFRKIK